MSIMTILVGLIAVTLDVLSSNQTNRSRLLAMLSASNLFSSIQYILLGAIAGALTCGVGLFRNFLLEKKDKCTTNLILYLLILIYSIMGIVMFDGIMSLLPTIASIIYVQTLWQTDIKKIKFGTIIVYLIWIVYDFYYGAYVTVIAAIMICIISLKKLISLNKESKLLNN